MDSGTITGWTLSEGDAFAAGDVLCSIETDKASVDFEAQDDGVLAKILKQGPSAVDLPVGTPICVVCEERDDVPAFADYVADTKTEGGGDDEATAAAAASESSDSTAKNATASSRLCRRSGQSVCG